MKLYMMSKYRTCMILFIPNDILFYSHDIYKSTFKTNNILLTV